MGFKFGKVLNHLNCLPVSLPQTYNKQTIDIFDPLETYLISIATGVRTIEYLRPLTTQDDVIF